MNVPIRKYRFTTCYIAVIVTLIFLFQMHHYFVRLG